MSSLDFCFVISTLNLPLLEGKLLWPGCCSGRPDGIETSPASAAGPSAAAAAAAGGSGHSGSRSFGVGGAGPGASTGEGSRGAGCMRRG